MHAHETSVHGAGAFTQCASGPACASYCTHGSPAPAQSAHDVTREHCVASMQPPQHPPVTVGNCPFEHVGAGVAQAIFDWSQLASVTH